MRKRLGVVVTALLLTSARIWAHHSFAAEYDINKPLTVSGTVIRFEWTNPHAWLYIDGRDQNGKAASWSFEMSSPNGLIHRGWTSTALKHGDHVTAEGYRAKDGSNVANASTVTLPDGRQLFARSLTTLGGPLK